MAHWLLQYVIVALQRLRLTTCVPGGLCALEVGFQSSCTIGSLSLASPTSPALARQNGCSLYAPGFLVGREGCPVRLWNEPIRGTLWREGLYYSQSGGVMLKGHHIQRQGQSANELGPSPTWQHRPLGGTEEMAAFAESSPHMHFLSCPLPSLLLPPDSCPFHGAVCTVCFGLGSVFRRISLLFSFLFT